MPTKLSSLVKKSIQKEETPREQQTNMLPTAFTFNLDTDIGRKQAEYWLGRYNKDLNKVNYIKEIKFKGSSIDISTNNFAWVHVTFKKLNDTLQFLYVND